MKNVFSSSVDIHTDTHSTHTQNKMNCWMDCSAFHAIHSVSHPILVYFIHASTMDLSELFSRKQNIAPEFLSERERESGSLSLSLRAVTAAIVAGGGDGGLAATVDT